MLWRPSSHAKLAQLADFLTTASSFFIAFPIWDRFRIITNIPLPIDVTYEVLWIILVMSIVWILIFSKQNAYSYLRFTSIRKELSIVAKTTFIGVAILMLSNFLLRFGHLPRTFVIIFAITNYLSLSAEKLFLFNIARARRKRGIGRKKVLLAGLGEETETFVNAVNRYFGWGLDIIGFVTEGGTESGNENKRILGSLEQIENILHSNIIDEVIICTSSDSIHSVRKLMECCEREGVQVRIFSNEINLYAKKVTIDSIYGINIISLINFPDDETSLLIKRTMDIVISCLLLALLSPIMLIIGLIIRIDSRGPILYRWHVVGLNKKPFKSWKYRTMIPNADEIKDKLNTKNEMKGPVFKIKNDPRITKVGRFLRKFSLDELPQLWSVVKGDMSLVGPRPAGPHELERYESWHRKKLCIKPGITCLWQVSGRNEISDFDDWVKMDLKYIENWSLRLDIIILVKTFLSVFKGTGC